MMSAKGERTKEELLGHCTLGVMALMGMALYSTTYALVYATTGTSTVAVLEMWMTSTHLVCSLSSFAVQVLTVSLFGQDRPLPYVGDAQAALFFGVACAVSVLGGACVQGGECGLFFGAAAVPQLAATGAIAWAWCVVTDLFFVSMKTVKIIILLFFMLNE
jgi:hypothetical protein